MSPFAFQPASTQHNEDGANPGVDEGRNSPALSQPLIRPATHAQMVHRLSRELCRSELPSMLSRLAGSRVSESAQKGASSTREVSSCVGSNAIASQEGRKGHTVKKADTSAWDQLVRHQLLEPPTAAQCL